MIQDFDFAILDWIQAHLKCGFLDFIMPKLTLLGEHGIFFMAVGVFLLIFRSKRRWGMTILGGMAGGLVIGNLILKNWVARLRPCQINTAVELLCSVPKDYSFPSGHTLHAFIVATVLMHFDKRFGIPALVFAILMAFSRLYLYMHFPTDVLTGAALGVGIGLLSSFLSDKIAAKWHERKGMKA